MSVPGEIYLPSDSERERAMSHPAYSALSSEFRQMGQDDFVSFFQQLLTSVAADDGSHNFEEKAEAPANPKASLDPRGEVLKRIPRQPNPTTAHSFERS